MNEIAEKYIEGTPQVGEAAVAPGETNSVSMVHGKGNEEISEWNNWKVWKPGRNPQTTDIT